MEFACSPSVASSHGPNTSRSVSVGESKLIVARGGSRAGPGGTGNKRPLLYSICFSASIFLFYY